MSTQDKASKAWPNPLEAIFADPAVTEVMIDSHEHVYVEKHGNFMDVASPFADEAALMDFIRTLAEMAGRKLDKDTPILDMRMDDSTLVNIVLPPIAMTGPSVTLRKQFTAAPLTSEKLIEFGSWSREIADFLQKCIEGRLNILVSGGTASGKTTLLNVMTSFIPENERIVTLEHDGELRPFSKFKHLVRLSTQPGDSEGRGKVALQDLVINAARMRPDRIIVSELRGDEVIHLIQLMNTGHDGAMASIHANSPRDAIVRLEGMVSMSGIQLPLLNVRESIAGALDLIVQQERLPDGTRKVVRIAEVTGMQGDLVALQDVFEFRRVGVENGKIQGFVTATGYIPKFVPALRTAGIDIPVGLFTPK